MADLVMKGRWLLDLSHEEYLLTMRALRCELRQGEGKVGDEVAQAKALCAEITKKRVQQLSAQIKQLEKVCDE